MIEPVGEEPAGDRRGVVNGAADHHPGRGGGGERRRGRGDDHRFVGGVAGARGWVVVGIAGVTRGPAIRAGPGRREAGRVVADVAVHARAVRERGRAAAGGVVRPIEAEGDRTGRGGAAGDRRGVVNGAADHHAGRGGGGERRRGRGDDHRFVGGVAGARGGIVVGIAGVTGGPAIRARLGRREAGRVVAGVAVHALAVRERGRAGASRVVRPIEEGD